VTGGTGFPYLWQPEKVCEIAAGNGESHNLTNIASGSSRNPVWIQRSDEKLLGGASLASWHHE
jgi:hypothetical protein